MKLPLFYYMKKNNGMTILETSIAMLILGIAILGILSGIYMASRISVSSRNRINAIQIAEAKVEEIKNRSYVDIQDEEFEVGSLPEGEGDVDVEKYKDDDNDGVVEIDEERGKKITVTVEWEEGERELDVQLATFVRKE